MSLYTSSMFDDPDVGSGQNLFYQPSLESRARIALVPAFISEREVVPSDDLKKKALSGDKDVINELAIKKKYYDILEKGVNKDPKTSLKVSEPEPGYLYARLDGLYSHYYPNMGSVLCKKEDYERLGRPATCCTKAPDGKEASLRYATIVLSYDTDKDGNVNFLKPEEQIFLDDKNRLDFKYSVKIWTLYDPGVKAWKAHQSQNPLVSTDYINWTEKKGVAKNLNFTPCRGDALWTQRGPVLIKKVLKEGNSLWERARKSLGQNKTLDEIDKMFGVSYRPPRDNVQRDYSSILGGD